MKNVLYYIVYSTGLVFWLVILVMLFTAALRDGFILLMRVVRRTYIYQYWEYKQFKRKYTGNVSNNTIHAIFNSGRFKSHIYLHRLYRIVWERQ